MSDVVVWLSPISIPPSIQERYRWDSSKQIGVSQSEYIELGRADCDGAQLVCVGRHHGRRGDRRHVDADTGARRLLDALRRRGPSALDEYLGPVAGVMVDGDDVVVWRDRFGRHPMQLIRLSVGWVATTDPYLSGRLSFCRPRWSHLSDFVCGAASTTDADVFDDLFRIRPGEYIRFSDHQLRDRRRWWDPSPRNIEEPTAQMRQILDDIGRLYGSQPHTLALSAGLDSATLGAVCSVRHPRSDALTFTDPASPKNEGPQAADVADYLGLDWTPFCIRDHWPMSRPEDHHFPIGWGPSAHPDFAWKMPCHRRLWPSSSNRPVVYGNGADEVLWCPAPLWLKSRWHAADHRALTNALRHIPTRRWLRLTASAGLDGLDHPALRSLIRPPERRSPLWQHPEYWIAARARPASPPEAKSPDRRFFLLRKWRLHTWRWERAMRSLALESRRNRRPIWTPFLDAQFWELCLSLNPGQLVEGGRQKSVLRQAVGDRLPEDCRQRPKIGGFDPVVERGLADRASPRVYALLARSQSNAWPDLDVHRFLDAYEAYRHGRSAHGPTTYRGSWAIWKTVATELWLRRDSMRDGARSNQPTEVRR